MPARASAHYRDDPFALFADVRRRGAVHPVTLIDGHDAWLVVRHDEARAALNDRRLSKDMHAAMLANAAVVSEGLPSSALAKGNTAKAATLEALPPR